MNQYHIHYFGLLAERRGLAEETVRHAALTPAELYQDLLSKHPLLPQQDLRAAVNDEFVSWHHVLQDNDRVAFLPPMSGG